MSSEDAAFDDFVDDCFIDKDPLCNKSEEDSLELVASQLIAELISEDDQNTLAA